MAIGWSAGVVLPALFLSRFLPFFAQSANSVLATLVLLVFSTAFASVRLMRTLGSVRVTEQSYLRVPVGVAISTGFLGE